VDAAWSRFITLEDLDPVDGTLFKKYYSSASDPMVLDEDRYEIYRGRQYPLYFIRRRH
jgi:hypothetical protein